MTKKALKESLIEQLVLMGADIEVFTDLIDKYMRFWDIAKALEQDIKKRGVTYTDKSSVGVEMQKNNPSIKELVAVNRQMLIILQQLNIKTTMETRECADEL